MAFPSTISFATFPFVFTRYRSPQHPSFAIFEFDGVTVSFEKRPIGRENTPTFPSALRVVIYKKIAAKRILFATVQTFVRHISSASDDIGVRQNANTYEALILAIAEGLIASN